jgi:hypothetical protein
LEIFGIKEMEKLELEVLLGMGVETILGSLDQLFTGPFHQRIGFPDQRVGFFGEKEFAGVDGSGVRVLPVAHLPGQSRGLVEVELSL